MPSTPTRFPHPDSPASFRSGHIWTKDGISLELSDDEARKFLDLVLLQYSELRSVRDAARTHLDACWILFCRARKLLPQALPCPDLILTDFSPYELGEVIKALRLYASTSGDAVQLNDVAERLNAQLEEVCGK